MSSSYPTAAILALNGLMATAEAMGTALPSLTRLTLALVMIMINVLWGWRAFRATHYIRALREEMYGGNYKKVLPAHARIHKDRYEDQRFPLLSSERLFAVVVTAGLVSSWTVGIVTVARRMP
jgi:hypothetical protein